MSDRAEDVGADGSAASQTLYAEEGGGDGGSGGADADAGVDDYEERALYDDPPPLQTAEGRAARDGSGAGGGAEDGDEAEALHYNTEEPHREGEGQHHDDGGGGGAAATLRGPPAGRTTAPLQQRAGLQLSQPQQPPFAPQSSSPSSSSASPSSASSSAPSGSLSHLRSVYVENLPIPVTEVELRHLFSPYGRVRNVKINVNISTGEQLGYGFIEFEREDEANNAVASTNQTVVRGRTLRTSIAKPKGTSSTGHRSMGGAGLAPGTMGGLSAAAGGVVLPAGMSRPAAGAGLGGEKVVDDCNLYVAGLPLSWSQSDVERCFASFGSINDCKLLINMATKESKGVAFVRFDDEANAAEAIRQLSGKQLEGAGGAFLQVRVAHKNERRPAMAAAAGAAGYGMAAAAGGGYGLGMMAASRMTGGMGGMMRGQLPLGPGMMGGAMTGGMGMGGMGMGAMMGGGMGMGAGGGMGGMGGMGGGMGMNGLAMGLAGLGGMGGLGMGMGGMGGGMGGGGGYGGMGMMGGGGMGPMAGGGFAAGGGGGDGGGYGAMRGSTRGGNRFNPMAASGMAGGMMGRVSRFGVAPQQQMGMGMAAAGGGGGSAVAVRDAASTSFGAEAAAAPPYINEAGEYVLFVLFLPDNITDNDLFQLFALYGPVSQVLIPRDKQTGAVRGFAFICMLNYRDAVNAIRYLNGHPVGNKRLKVAFKENKEQTQQPQQTQQTQSLQQPQLS